MKRRFTLTLENCDLETEELEQEIASALDGYLGIDEDEPIVLELTQQEPGS
jgi:hypothetical protein